MKILEAEPSDLPSFFEYLGVQLLDNASDDTPLFQPIAKKSCHITPELEMKFRDGFESRVGEPSWRKLWVAKDSNGDIRGHIDLRHHSGEYRSHRVLLGMGVDTSVM